MMEGFIQNEVTELTPEGKRALVFAELVINAFPYDIRESVKGDTEALESIKAQCMAFVLGVKPAIVFERLNVSLPLEDFLINLEKNFFVYEYKVGHREMTMIVDVDLVEKRIEDELVEKRKDMKLTEEELAFIEGLGWNEGMTVEEWLIKPNAEGRKGVKKSIVGFVLGIPLSAVSAYAGGVIENAEVVKIEGGNGGDTMRFVTGHELVKAPDVLKLQEAVKQAFKDCGLLRV